MFRKSTLALALNLTLTLPLTLVLTLVILPNLPNDWRNRIYTIGMATMLSTKPHNKGVKRKRPRPNHPSTPSRSPQHHNATPKLRKSTAGVIPDANWKQLLHSGKVRVKPKSSRKPATKAGKYESPAGEGSSSVGWSKSASDLAEKVWASDSEKNATRVVALDCEMVGVGHDMKSRLARVCVVTEKGKVMLDKFCRPAERITDFRTRWSGIRAVDLLNAPPVASVQQEVADLIRGKVVVGHALKHDFDVLLYKHKLSLVRDTAAYRPLQKKKKDGSGKLRKPKLRDLALQELEWVIQEGEHDPYVDARAALEIYMKHKDEWERWLKEKRQSRQSRRASKKRKRHHHEESIQRQLQRSKDIFARKR